MVRGRFIFVVAIFLVQILALTATFAYPFKSRIFPSIALSLGLVLSIFQIFRELPILKEKEIPKTGDETIRLSHKHLVIGAWIVGTTIMLWVLGFMWTVVAFPFIYLRYHRESWPISIILPIACGIIFYFFFGQFLRTPLYPGLLLPLITGRAY